jgi:hypothetical protein
MPGGNFINHFTAVRLRVTGSGSLLMQLQTLDDVIVQDISPLTMSATTPRYANQLTNFTQQKSRLVIKTNEIDETFFISQLILYVKPVATGFPQ